jgi:hypothetical protein
MLAVTEKRMSNIESEVLAPPLRRRKETHETFTDRRLLLGGPFRFGVYLFRRNRGSLESAPPDGEFAATGWAGDRIRDLACAARAFDTAGRDHPAAPLRVAALQQVPLWLLSLA